MVPPAPVAASRYRSVVVRRTRGAVHRLAAVPRIHRRPGPDGARLRGHALGRRIDVGLPGVPDPSRRERAAPGRRHRPPRTVRTVSGHHRRPPEHDAHQPHAAVRRRDRTSGRCAAGDCRGARGSATTGPRSGRREPALRRGVRAPAEGPRPGREDRCGLGTARRRGSTVPPLGPSLDRRATGHALAGDEVDPVRRGGRREGLLGGRRRADGRPRRERRHRRAARAFPQGARPPGTPFVDRGGIRVRVLAHPRPRRRVRAAPPSVSSISPRRGGPVDRIQDARTRPGLADMLAYHYTTALELTRATEGDEHASGLEAPALRFLSLAGERALGLDTTTAITSLERALALAPEGIRHDPAALFRFGEAAFQGGRLAEASDALDEAVASFTADGDLPAAARAMGALGNVAVRLGIAGGRSCRETRSRCWSRSAPPPSSSARSPRSATSRRCSGDLSVRSPSPSERWRSPTNSGWGAQHARSASAVSPAATSAITEVSTICARPS